MRANNQGEAPKDNPEYWREPVPKDPPTETDGEGPSKDDLLDYGGTHIGITKNVLPFLVPTYPGPLVYQWLPARVALITADNPHFDLENCCKSGGPRAWASGVDYYEHGVVESGDTLYRAKETHESAAQTEPETGAQWETKWTSGATINLAHKHHLDDYGDIPGAPEAWGISFWNWTYAKYTPNPPPARGWGPRHTDHKD